MIELEKEDLEKRKLKNAIKRRRKILRKKYGK